VPTTLRSGCRQHEYAEPLLRKTITIPTSSLRLLEQEGRGNLSEGVRLMVEHACTPNGYYWFPMGRPGPRRQHDPCLK
jgi:hypothetical protein